MMYRSLFRSLVLVIIVAGVSCGEPPAGADPICGDGVVNPGVEECDDGNDRAGDGCGRTCQREGCGNGQVDPGEECDDSNENNADACTNSCLFATCGDGVRRLDILEGEDGYEACDDGNQDEGIWNHWELVIHGTEVDLDSDGDGIDDAVEGVADMDGDGVNNDQEN